MSLCDRFRGQVRNGIVEAVEIVSTSSELCNTWSLLPAYEGESLSSFNRVRRSPLSGAVAARRALGGCAELPGAAAVGGEETWNECAAAAAVQLNLHIGLHHVQVNEASKQDRLRTCKAASSRMEVRQVLSFLTPVKVPLCDELHGRSAVVWAAAEPHQSR
eukprot:CAMPEP_0177532880 /NCGR_PEP_ID=MMETSP0369-20130122/54954_1 /TAXON_ID=447022 ORGANISM="Scrippsiella hangoei-like, Strain SHHI-4" /NCGR_SAMPLE_ID=MMETSP0369 /ASSEMBLY_ACC=CAM_ASM_000364 /LENGTH=160 /DNA_ID=CAMNT_0019014403 /DNA_START=159 /DNA_END=636 /DNA_ORIENTATION=+